MPRVRFAANILPQCHFFLLLLLALFTGPRFVLGQDNRLAKFASGRRQLFLDDYAISSVKNLTRTLHQPEKRGAVITPQRPWEKYLVQTRSVPAWDEERNVFQLWVNAIDREPDFMAGPTYFESKDGIHWTRPILRQFEYGGSRENNILAFDPKLKWPARAITNVIRDPHDPDSARRYKGFLGKGRDRRPIVSPDGIHWKQLNVPVLRSSDESNLSYDPLARIFIATLKHGGRFGRAHAISTSRDFEHWTKPKLLYQADIEDQKRGKARILARLADPNLQDPVYNNPSYYKVDIYNVGLFRYEDLYIILPAMFHITGPRPNGNVDGFKHVQLACSRDLDSWTRLGDRQPFIDTSPVGDAWDTMVMLPPSAPLVRGDELWFYYSAGKYRGTPPSPPPHRGAVCLAVLRRDGFMSLDAGDKQGTLTTKPFVTRASSLHVNIDAAGGAGVVEVLDREGSVLAVSKPMSEDEPRRRLAWAEGDLADFAGQTIRFRFHLRNARLYSFWLDG